VSDDALATLCTASICLGLWGGLAAAAVGLAQWRVRRVEATLGRRAEPSEEAVQLFYAGASVVYLSAAILALVGLAKKDWARTGRNCLLFFIGHISLVIAGMPFVVPGQDEPDAAALVLNKPENVRVGIASFRLSLLNLAGIGLLVCITLPFLAHSVW